MGSEMCIRDRAVTARGIHEFMAARRYSLYPHPATLFLLNLAPAQTPASATSHTRPARHKKVFIPYCVSGSIFFYKVKNISGIVDKVGLGDPAAWPVYRDTLQPAGMGLAKVNGQGIVTKAAAIE